MVSTFVLSGTPESFNQTRFAERLASNLTGVSPSDIDLVVTAASIKVQATIRVSGESEANQVAQQLQSSTNPQLAEILGETVESASEIRVTKVEVASPYPPPVPPPIIPTLTAISSNLEEQNGSDDATGTGSGASPLATGLSIAALIASTATLCTLCFLAWRWTRGRREEPPPKPAPAKPPQYEQEPEPAELGHARPVSNDRLPTRDIEQTSPRSSAAHPPLNRTPIRAEHASQREEDVPLSARQSAYEAQYAALAAAERASQDLDNEESTSSEDEDATAPWRPGAPPPTAAKRPSFPASCLQTATGPTTPTRDPSHQTSFNGGSRRSSRRGLPLTPGQVKTAMDSFDDAALMRMDDPRLSRAELAKSLTQEALRVVYGVQGSESPSSEADDDSRGAQSDDGHMVGQGRWQDAYRRGSTPY